jgi:hypothetical protein
VLTVRLVRLIPPHTGTDAQPTEPKADDVTTPSDAAPNWNGGDLPFARDLFSAADQLRGSVESAEYSISSSASSS